MRLVAELGDKYQIDELAAKYAFTGRTPMTIPQALEIKEELETIDRLLKQLAEAAQTGQIGVIDMEQLAEYADPGDIEQLNRLAQQIERVSPRPGRTAGIGPHRPRIRTHAQGVPAVSGTALGTDLQQLAGVADGPARGGGGGRRQRGTAADASLRVRRLAARHGYSRLAGQRHAPQRAGTARADAAGRYHRASHPQHAQVRHGGAAWT